MPRLSGRFSRRPHQRAPRVSRSAGSRASEPSTMPVALLSPLVALSTPGAGVAGLGYLPLELGRIRIRPGVHPRKVVLLLHFAPPVVVSWVRGSITLSSFASCKAATAVDGWRIQRGLQALVTARLCRSTSADRGIAFRLPRDTLCLVRQRHLVQRPWAPNNGYAERCQDLPKSIINEAKLSCVTCRRRGAHSSEQATHPELAASPTRQCRRRRLAWVSDCAASRPRRY